MDFLLDAINPILTYTNWEQRGKEGEEWVFLLLSIKEVRGDMKNVRNSPVRRAGIKKEKVSDRADCAGSMGKGLEMG